MIPRTADGRPRIIKKPGGKAMLGYHRTSSLSGWLGGSGCVTTDDVELDHVPDNLAKWQMRNVALGMLLLEPNLRLDLSGDVVVLQDMYREQLGALAEAAFRAGGGLEKADRGTRFHAYTELMDAGLPLQDFPESYMAAALESYEEETADLQVIESEVFCVNDELLCAGTLDALYRLPDGRVVCGDKKTGSSEPRYPKSVNTQVAAYARSKRYNSVTGERTPLHPDLDPTVGLLIHSPLDGRPCRVYELDLVHGWNMCLQAKVVRDLVNAPLRPTAIHKKNTVAA